ncbi:hypothetical protein [Protaetiibacter intestinalis]|uniref:Alternate-type signal peptide domain-containing protein n=1 Tax=Protaetiibacter intestinalis TaxID=2419774 RepID=A0A387BCH0_9MICO|nr:hypothetical protein [Protaetiibacter intestinalis]AYF98796.1 hypothetical protein D7I47_11405 [Protaetiibacter intestinalis]
MTEKTGAGARARSVALVLVGLLLGGAGAVTTAAAWRDDVFLGAEATPSTFDIQARTGTVDRHPTDPDIAPVWTPGAWYDVGLPGDPDTLVVPIVAPTVGDLHPLTSYAVPIELCNDGDVDGEIAEAIITTDTGLVELTSIDVDTIDVGTTIPADSCASDGAAEPLFGWIQFTTTDFGHDLDGSAGQFSIQISVVGVQP